MRTRYILPIILIIAGLLCIVSGITAYFVIPYVVKQQIKDALIVKSDKSKGYGAFIDSRNGEDGGGGLYVSYIIFNLTNPEDFKAGRKLPNFSSVGPFVYIKRTQKSEVTFLNGGVQVRYKGQISYTFVPEKSGVSNDTTANLLVVNPYFVAAQEKAGGGTKFSLGFVAKYLKNLQDLLLAENLGFTTDSKCVSLLPNMTKNLCTYYDFKRLKGLSDTYSSALGNKMLASFTNLEELLEFTEAVNVSIVEYNADKRLMDIFEKWGAPFTQQAAYDLMSYLDFFSDQIFLTAGSKFGSEFGSIFKRTSAHRFIFEEDEFSKILLNHPGERLYLNESEYNLSSYYTSYTGHGDEGDTNGKHFTEYASVKNIEIYKKKYPMNFRINAIQSFMDDIIQTADFYYDLIQRTFPTYNSGSDSYQGLPVQVYVVNSTLLGKVDADYDNFNAGLVFLPLELKGAPISVSPPYFSQIDQKFTSMLNGMDIPLSFNHISSISIEPFTGLATATRLKFQLNLRMDFSRYPYQGINNSLVLPDLVLPMIIEGHEEYMSARDAAFLKKAIGDPTNLAFIILYVFLAIGYTSLIAGLVILLLLVCCLDKGKSVFNEPYLVPEKSPKKLKKDAFVVENFGVLDDDVSKKPMVTIISKSEREMQVSELDIQIVMMNADVDRETAIDGLIFSEGDVINAILYLSKKPIFPIIMSASNAPKQADEKNLKTGLEPEGNGERGQITVISNSNKKLNLSEMDIEIVMRHSECTRLVAIEGLKYSEGDVVNAIQKIMKKNHFHVIMNKKKK